MKEIMKILKINSIIIKETSGKNIKRSKSTEKGCISRGII